MLSFLGAHWIALASTLGIGGGLSAASLFIPGFAAYGIAVVKAVGEWLSRRSLGELCSIALVLMLVWLIPNRNHWKSVAEQRQTELNNAAITIGAYKAQLDALSSKKNEQKIQTQTRIVSVTRTIHDADERAKKIETAPIAPTSCHGATPKVVLGADL